MKRHTARNIWHLGIKELRSLWSDKIMLGLILFMFTVGIYVAAGAQSRELHNAPIAFVDNDRSPLSERIIDAFYPPHFKHPEHISQQEIDPGMDEGLYTFVLVIPPEFQHDVLAGKLPEIQVNVDATRMTQAFIGSSYISSIINGEVLEFVRGYRTSTPLPIDLAVKVRFNPNLNGIWFGSVMEIMTNITILSIILTGAALIRERERGTIEHLLVMPLTPLEIMGAKVWANGIVVLASAMLSLFLVVKGLFQVPIAGSITLFMIGAMLHLFSTTSIGIFLGTIARSMPQFGLLIILVILPMQLLSGGVTPRESMPEIVQNIMLISPTTHFVNFSKAIMYRGAGINVVWKQFAVISLIGTVFFLIALTRFRKTVAQTQL
ncbi:ABC transporter permease [Prosthecochloris sp.]|uniref:ABC transporter permease n=1 Tax=Prosthecochloris sp. TaxID=290513 RepID=UPI00257D7970|nr:ABC transporter permease [Prosthecochloris sp.]